MNSAVAVVPEQNGQSDGAGRAGGAAGAAGVGGAGEGRRPGRPRSEQAEQAIIDAALDLFGERGVEGVCVEAVAARAGVGKATIYRRWASKEELLIAALGSMKSPMADPDTGNVRDDLVELLSVLVRDVDDPKFSRQFAMLHGEGEAYPRLLERYRETVTEPRRQVIRTVLHRLVHEAL